jgi:hypothetical protein
MSDFVYDDDEVAVACFAQLFAEDSNEAAASLDNPLMTPPAQRELVIKRLIKSGDLHPCACSNKGHGYHPKETASV